MAKKKVVEVDNTQEAVVKYVASKALTITDKAKALTITTDADQQMAGEMLKAINGLQGEIDATFDPIIKAAHEGHKVAISQKKKAEGPLVEAKAIINPKYAAYQRLQEVKRQEEVNRLRRVAEQQAREKAEEERLALAQRLAEQGKMDEAAEVIDGPVYVEPVKASQTYVAPVAKVEGVSVRKTYYAEVYNFPELIRAVVAGKVPVMAIQADQQFLDKQARAFKDTDMMGYPGVRVVDKDSVASGR